MHSPFVLGAPSLKSTPSLVLVLSLALLAGCASKGRLLMPTPALYQQDPGASMLFADTYPSVERPTSSCSSSPTYAR